MVAAFGKNATKMLVILDELAERNGLERIAIFHRKAQADGSRAEGHLAVAERLRTFDPVTGDPDLPAVLDLVTADVVEFVTEHFVIGFCGYVTQFRLLK